ncbi:MAG: N-acetylneuraminate synthase family protein [Lachnospiraceae bacterium]|nr:N-acetylneuraminate synthase family protein [Lachnospiraceae bacterium]
MNNDRFAKDNRTYIIAEMNSSHNGNLDTAKKMIDSAAECGCDCVKFQSWTSDTLYSEEYYKNNPISERIVKKFSISEDGLKELCDYCRTKGIDFSSTPYSEKEVDFLADTLDVPFIKIASMEINNPDFLKYIAGKNKPVILSTGMSTIEEIEEAVRAIESTGNDKICILHCVSVYPADAGEINLMNIRMLQDRFDKYRIGYSDHTIGHEVACAAVALGASVIEKHFTLDNSKMGMDNNMATEPEEMKALVTACRNVARAMGSYDRVLSENERVQAAKMRRSVISARELHKGDVLSREDLEVKRPGDGIPPAMLPKLVGSTIRKDYPKGYQIKEEDIDLRR